MSGDRALSIQHVYFKYRRIRSYYKCRAPRFFRVGFGWMYQFGRWHAKAESMPDSGRMIADMTTVVRVAGRLISEYSMRAA